MCKGTNDNGAYNRMTRTLPKQPSRCIGIKTLYNQPTYVLFLKSVKTWIRTCVEEGRENELLDNNESLVSVWSELQGLPTSMDLARGKSIQVIPHYDWESTSGPPFWRAKKITFTVHHRVKTAPPIPQYYVPPDPKLDPVPVPKDQTRYFYCSEAGVKSVFVRKGERPKADDAKSPFFTDEASARNACRIKPDDPTKPDTPTIDLPKPTNRKLPKDDDDSSALRMLAATVFSIFGVVIFYGKLAFVVESIVELYELKKTLEKLFPKKDVEFQLDTNNKRLSLKVLMDGKAQSLDEFIDELYKNGVIDRKEYDRLKDLSNKILLQLQELELERSKRLRSGQSFFSRKGLRDVVRGYFIEDAYIERVISKTGYVGLPDYFKGFDAYKQGAKFTIEKLQGRYVAVFDNPGLISVKSYDPGGLKNIDLNSLEERLRGWISKMDYQEFEKENIRIVNPKKKEIHLILVGDEAETEFRDKVQGILNLGGKYGITINPFQYRKDTGRFVPLGAI